MPLPDTMPAWTVTAYGGPEVLDLREVPLPRPGPKDVLIRVAASTVSSGDRRIRALDFPPGLRLAGRLGLGWRRPRQPVLGAELTGTIVATGTQVTRWHPGDAVIAMTGLRGGGHGAYARLPETAAMVPRPADMPLEVAAALSFGGTTARDFLRRGDLRPAERVLVIGASGTVGSALVQLAVAGGAQVSAVTSAGNADLVAGLGVAEVIDYRRQNILTLGRTFDIVADTVGAPGFAKGLPLLAEGGRYLAIDGSLRDMLVRRRAGRRCIAGPATERADDLAALCDLWAAGRFAPLIDSTLPFEALPQAHARADSRRKRGSVVVVLPAAAWAGASQQRGQGIPASPVAPPPR
ncbi:MAG: NAD(P)-dependent alcohol dehydrogenase [Rhodobacterales bacterium]|nr:NAD(P)-dependent alcohol dehydrogenase [Rhodobacterales bacterium]MDX5499564.1 NAD(P)-dependent alcohol dehydrogenase [Rhodobacterales bacterium]